MKQKIQETYSENEKELKGVDISTFAQYLNEYLENKDKWDKPFFTDTKSHINLNNIRQISEHFMEDKTKNIIVLGTGGSIQTLSALKHLAKKKVFPVLSSRAVELKGCLDKTFDMEYKTIFLKDKKGISSTSIREQISSNILNSEDFRAGIIAGQYQNYPISYSTVDIIVSKKENGKTLILLGQKPIDKTLNKWVFPGGFIDKGVTSIRKELNREIEIPEVKEHLKKFFEKVFGVELDQ